MPTTTWRELWELHDRVEQVFREMTAAPEVTPLWTPATDVSEEAEAYWVRFDLPGVAAEQVKLETREGSLWLSGEKPAPADDANAAESPRVLRGERRYGRFAASVPLPRDAQHDQISARLAEGVLTVRVPRRAGELSRTIPVEKG
jgi:HSP20 family protein